MFFYCYVVYFFSCATFQPHKSEIYPVELENGKIHVKIKWHDKDRSDLGASVNAYSRECRQRLNSKGMDRTICAKKVVGEGKIIKILEDSTSFVEFQTGVKFDESTEFEIK